MIARPEPTSPEPQLQCQGFYENSVTALRVWSNGPGQIKNLRLNSVTDQNGCEELEFSPFVGPGELKSWAGNILLEIQTLDPLGGGGAAIDIAHMPRGEWNSLEPHRKAPKLAWTFNDQTDWEWSPVKSVNFTNDLESFRRLYIDQPGLPAMVIDLTHVRLGELLVALAHIGNFRAIFEIADHPGSTGVTLKIFAQGDPVYWGCSSSVHGLDMDKWLATVFVTRKNLLAIGVDWKQFIHAFCSVSAHTTSLSPDSDTLEDLKLTSIIDSLFAVGLRSVDNLPSGNCLHLRSATGSEDLPYALSPIGSPRVPITVKNSTILSIVAGLGLNPQLFRAEYRKSETRKVKMWNRPGP